MIKFNEYFRWTIMLINIDEEILELLDFLNVKKDKKELLINILLIEGIEATVSNENFVASEMTKKNAKNKVLNLKIKYIVKML